jgi:hypothetical protein
MQVLAVATAERGVDAEDDALGGVEAETEAVILFEPLQVEVRALEGDLAGVIEKRGVEP